MPGYVIGSSLSFVGEAWIGSPDTAGGAVQPQRHVNANTVPSPRTTATVKPPAFANPSTPRPAAVLRIASPATLAGNAIIRTASATFTAKPQVLTNTPVFIGPRLTLMLSPAVYANSSVVRAAAVMTLGKSAPHRPSTAQVFFPAVTSPAFTTVTATLNVAGWTPSAPKRKSGRAPVGWPNLPKVDAPPWRLTVVTADVARTRARALIAQTKRANRLRRRRQADEQAGAIFNKLLDEQILHTIVDVVASR